MKEIILSHKAEKEKLLAKGGVLREELKTIRSGAENKLIRVIVGPRRAGKSTFAFQWLKDKNFAYVNFDDDRLSENVSGDKMIEAVKAVYGDTPHLLLDEIQNIPRWELFVNRLQRQGYQLVITGSNSQLLSSELATHLTGRFAEHQILPFSFREYLTAGNINPNEPVNLPEARGLILNHLDQYIKEGGYPEIVVDRLDPKSYLKTLFESILFKDIVKRYKVRFAQKLSDLGHYLMTNHSSEYSFSRLSKLLGFRSIHTVENYVCYLEQAYLTFSINRYSPSLKSQIKSPKKAYAYDNGMIHAVKFDTSPDTGRLLENLVGIELKRRRQEFYSYQTEDNKKVDFAVKQGVSVRQLIQVCHDLSDHRTKQREFKALAKTADELKCRSLLVLTWAQKGGEEYKGYRIACQPVWEWLLNQ